MMEFDIIFLKKTTFGSIHAYGESFGSGKSHSSLFFDSLDSPARANHVLRAHQKYLQCFLASPMTGVPAGAREGARSQL